MNLKYKICAVLWSLINLEQTNRLNENFFIKFSMITCMFCNKTGRFKSATASLSMIGISKWLVWLLGRGFYPTERLTSKSFSGPGGWMDVLTWGSWEIIKHSEGFKFFWRNYPCFPNFLIKQEPFVFVDYIGLHSKVDTSWHQPSLHTSSISSRVSMKSDR